MGSLNNFTALSAETIRAAAEKFGTPLYLYDGDFIADRCAELLAMPHAFGLTVRYAMKANSTGAILRLIADQGLHIDASSLNEAKRARMAGIGCEKIILTTQELPAGQERAELEELMLSGMRYNACSLRQLYAVGDFASAHGIKLAIRVHPGVGSGESASRNTGDKYSCFGVHLSDLPAALEYAERKGLVFDHVHEHIGSGGEPEDWRRNIDTELAIVEKYFPRAVSASFGGGLKEARMPGESRAGVGDLGGYLKEKVLQFYEKTGRKLKVEIEPGMFVVANSGYIVTRVIDKKRTGSDGFNFVIADGGMELNARPLMYGSAHPFYVVSQSGELLSSEFSPEGCGLKAAGFEAAVVGRCCESGDSQSLDECGLILPRAMAEPDVGDLFVVGGAGAYCSSMAPMNYNSHCQAPEILAEGGALRLIRKRQTLEQMTANEL